MADEPVVIMLSGNVVQLDEVARRLGVSRAKLVRACRDAAGGSATTVEAFYDEWLSGQLPVAVRPCSSRSLYGLYQWWCRDRSVRPESETKVLTALPIGLTKVRRRVVVGNHQKMMTVIEPDDWRPDERPLCDQLGEHQMAFEREMVAII